MTTAFHIFAKKGIRKQNQIPNIIASAMDIRLCFILALGALGVSGMLPIGLRHRSTVFVPFAYGTDGAPDTFTYDAGVAEQVAVDKEQHIAYTIGMCLDFKLYIFTVFFYYFFFFRV